MKRSLQEVVELVVFGLVALLIGTGLLWVVGWVLSLGGLLLKAIAGLLWLLLRFVVPVAIVAGLVYFLVKALQGRNEPQTATAGAGASSASASANPGTSAPHPAPAVAPAAPATAAASSSSAPAAAEVPPEATPDEPDTSGEQGEDQS